jgi:integrase
VWWIRYYRSGKRYEESSGSTKKGVAIDLLRVRGGDIARGVPITPKIGRMLFEEAAADVVNDYRVNGRRTLAHVERRIKKHLQPYFGGRRMPEITTADARAFAGQRQQAGASSAEINRELAIVKRAFSLAVQGGRLLTRPHIPMLKENNVRTGFFERQEFEDVRAHLPSELRDVATFAYLTGWRVPSEVLTLEWRQVDRQAGIVRLEPGRTKNDCGRVFPYGDLLPELRDVIEARWAETKRIEQSHGVICPYVFHRRGGLRRKGSTVREGQRVRSFRGAWEAACTAAGIPGRIPHDLRRTAVRNLVRAGISERVAMQLTGHKSRSVFDRYDIVNEADLREAVRKYGEPVVPRATGTGQGQSEAPGRVSSIGRRSQG